MITISNFTHGLYVVIGRQRMSTTAAIRRIRGVSASEVHFVEDFGDHLHHEDIRVEVEHMRESREAWVCSTMNPTVLNLFGAGSLDDVRSRYLFASDDGILSRMDEDEARAFFADYEVGIERVADLLRRRALW